MARFTKREQALIIDSVETQLTHQPTLRTRHRKQMRPNPLAAWELRVGDLRVYYDVTDAEMLVRIVAVGVKIGSQVFINDRVVEL
jgi:mRNA interferase RelE/StbE